MNADLPAFRTFRTKLQRSYCNTAKCPDRKRRITGQSQDNVIRAQKIDLRLFTVSSTSLLSSLMAGLSPSHFSDSVFEGVSGPEPRLAQQSGHAPQSAGWEGCQGAAEFPPVLGGWSGPALCSPPSSRSGLPKPKNTREQLCLSSWSARTHHAQMPYQGMA